MIGTSFFAGGRNELVCGRHLGVKIAGQGRLLRGGKTQLKIDHDQRGFFAVAEGMAELGTLVDGVFVLFHSVFPGWTMISSRFWGHKD
jgi:hypothetical protein